jgi:myo-inositol 2-dehydrogenase/D-chiro-inositol 1-dehydrogenase
MSYGVAFAGAGFMASKHAAMLAQDPRACLVAALGADPASERARAFATTHGFDRVATDFDQLLDDDAVQIVFVCSPDATHADYVVRALAAGKHVLCEKPLARTEAEFGQIKDALAVSGKVLQVGMNCRFRSQYLNVKERADGRLGELRFLRGTYVVNSVEPVRTAQKPWHLEFPSGYLPFLYGGALHCLDLLRWIGGSIPSVFARAGALELGNEWDLDTFSASFRFASGALGEFTCSAAAFRPPDFALEAWMRDGSVVAGAEYRRSGDGVDPQGAALAVDQPRLDVALQFDDLLGAIESGRPPLNSATEAHENFRVLAAMDRSAKTGAPVEVEGVSAPSRT